MDTNCMIVRKLFPQQLNAVHSIYPYLCGYPRELVPYGPPRPRPVVRCVRRTFINQSLPCRVVLVLSNGIARGHVGYLDAFTIFYRKRLHISSLRQAAYGEARQAKCTHQCRVAIRVCDIWMMANTFPKFSNSVQWIQWSKTFKIIIRSGASFSTSRMRAAGIMVSQLCSISKRQTGNLRKVVQTATKPLRNKQKNKKIRNLLIQKQLIRKPRCRWHMRLKW